jgi:hypothetical protein
MNDLIRNHPSAATFAVAGFCWLIGLLEQLILRRSDITSVTWAFGLLIATIGLVGMVEIGNARWVLAPLLLIGGVAFLFKFHKKSA